MDNMMNILAFVTLTQQKSSLHLTLTSHSHPLATAELSAWLTSGETEIMTKATRNTRSKQAKS